MKVVREHYLRDDVWCGASHCTNCAQADESLLDSTPLSSSKLCSFPHYLTAQPKAGAVLDLLVVYFFVLSVS